MKKSKISTFKIGFKRIITFCLFLFFALVTTPLILPAQVDTLYEDVPDMPEQDLNKMMVWLKSRVAIIKTPYCWRDSYGRGVGALRTLCPENSERNAMLCYPKCNAGYTGNGPVCWQNCPSGFRDDGAFCRKPDEYGRGAGRIPDKKPCSAWNAAYRDDGTSCWLDTYGRGAGRIPDKKPCSAFNSAYRDDGTSCWLDTYGRGGGYAIWNEGKCNNENKPLGCEKWGAMWYPKCKAGYHNAACCLCEPNGGPGIKVTAFQRYQCRADEDLNGALCYPKCKTGYSASGCCLCSPAEGAGIKVTAFQRYQCKPEEELNGALCYPKCKAGYHAVGCCVCSYDCPPDMLGDAGVSCTKKSYGRGAGTVPQCPPPLIADETGGPAGLCYPQCKTDYHGIGPVCWQNCPNGLVDCAAGCAASNTECASTTFSQVFSVVMVAVNIATFGSSSAAMPALKAGEEAVQVGTSFVKVGGKLMNFQKKFWKTIDVLAKAATKVKDATVVQKIMKIYNSAPVQIGIKLVKVGKWEYNTMQDMKHSFAAEFSELTSPEINSEIDSKFNPLVAKYIKETWADIQMAEMAQTNGFVIAHDVLSYVSIVDPTGILSVVDAFTKPICGANVPWPTLLGTYK
jgi:hypothetical protein